ncbi:MAG: TolC family protein [Desulfobacterales bacterium]|nr:TolC family protein [Desulfobacterales bacterium]
MSYYKTYMIIVTFVLFLVCFSASFLFAEDIPGQVYNESNNTKASGPINLETLQVLDLNTAKQIALVDNLSLAASRDRIQQADAMVKQALSAYLPKVDLTASASRVNLSDDDHSSALLSAMLFDPSATIDNPSDHYTAGLTANWLLFNGLQRKYSIAAARYGKEGSKDAYADARRLILSSVTLLYYNAQLARENIAIAEADKAFYLRQLEEAKARRLAGTGSLSDELSFQIQVNAAESTLLDARKAHDISKYSLAAILGIPDADFPEHLELARLKAETKDETILPEVSPLITFARGHRPDIRQVKHILKQTEASVKMARGDYFPMINLSASYDGSREEDASFEGENFGNSVSVIFSYNLFAGGIHRAKIKEAIAKKKEAEKDLKNLEINLVSEIKTAVAELRLAQEQLALQRSNVVLVNKNRDLVEKSYNAGQASLVRLNGAQRDLVFAQTRLAFSLVTLRKAWYDLDTVTAKGL